MTSPAAGCTPVHSAVAITGPRTKVNSSVTDSNAAAVDISGDAGRSGVAPSIAAQRARTMGPTCGIEAPVGTAAANSAHRGASASARTVRALTETAWSRTPGRRTARCPKRSASFPLCGANSAMETPETAATAPALPYEPVVCCTRRTMPMVSIAKGCRAAKPGRRKVHAPGVRSSCPYPGRSETVVATVLAFLPPGSPASRRPCGAGRTEAAESCPLRAELR